MNLSSTERARCLERLGVAARTVPALDPLSAENRAYYDAVVKAYASARAGQGVAGLKCPFGAGAYSPKAGEVRIPGSSCWVVLPRGAGTEELGLPSK